MNMMAWLEKSPTLKKPLPILSFPGIQITGHTVAELVHSGKLKAECMHAISERFDCIASVSLMDLSVEAEAFGSPVRYDDAEVPTVTDTIINSLEDAKALKIPGVGDARTGEYIKAIEHASKLIVDRPILAGAIGPFSLAGRLISMTEIMIKCYTDPDEVLLVLNKATEFLIKYIEAFKAAGANGVILAEPAAGLLSPGFITEFSSPFVRRIIDKVEDESFVIIYHNCGPAAPLVDGIMETGAQAFSFGNAVKLEDMLDKIPKNKIVIGNVDPSMIRNGSKADVINATNDVLAKCSMYPNFILSSGCDIPPMTPLENIEAFFDTAYEFYNK